MSRKKGFMQNTAIMFTAMFITKFLGALLKIPLGNILGGEGMGYFTTAYSIFTPVLAFAASGIPTIVTQSVAESVARGKPSQAARTKSCALRLAAVIGLAGTLAVCLAAMPFAYFIANSPESLPAVFLIAPSVFFCSVTAVYRGYYEGLSDTFPTAASQVIEAIVKVILGVGLSYIVFVNGEGWFGSKSVVLPYSAGAAILGVTISESSSMLYMMFRSRKDRNSLDTAAGRLTFREAYGTAADIFRKSLPIAIGACAGGVLSFVDMLTVSNCINLSPSLFGGFREGSVISEIFAERGGGTGNFMYGSYAGLVMSIYMLTGAAAGLVARCMLPRLTCAVSSGDRAAVSDNIGVMVKGTAMITLPMSMFTAALSEPLLRLLYASKPQEAAVSVLPLQILSIGGIAAGLCTAVGTVFNAHSEFIFPIKASLISGGLKILLNIALIIIPSVNIAGAAAATVISNVFCLVYAARELKRRFSVSFPVKSVIPSLLAAIASGAVLSLTYRAALSAMPNVLTMLFSLFIASLMYVFILFAADSRELVRIVSSLKKCRS